MGVSGEPGVAISFVPNATYGLNEIAYSLTPNKSFIRPEKIKRPIYLSDSEHASNHLIWLRLSEKPINYLPLNEFKNWKLPQEPSIFSFACSTNLEGIQIPISQINKKFENTKGKHLCIVDASQLFQYEIPDLSNSPIDYLVFTAHKCFGPNGIGVVYSKNQPIVGVNSSNIETTKMMYDLNWDALEGWLNVMNIWEDLHTSGFLKGAKENLRDYFVQHFPYDNELLEWINPKSTGNIFLLKIKSDSITAHDYAFGLSRKGIAVRPGISCAWLVGQKYDSRKLIRVSLGPFNTTEDLRRFFKVIKKFSLLDCL